jgi:Flp pilus assembly protein TadG
VAVEFAFLFPIALVFVFGLLEFGLILFDYHRLGEATRRGARMAIIQDIIGTASSIPSSDVVCTGSGSTISDYSVSCTNGATENAASFQSIVQDMQGIKADLVGNNVIVTYRDSGVTGGVDSPGIVTPVVTVEITGYEYTFFLLSMMGDLLGDSSGNITGTMTFPDFATSRMGGSQNAA